MLLSGLTLTKSFVRRVRAVLPGRTSGAVVAIAGIITGVGYTVAGGQETPDAYKLSRDSQQGKNISPVLVELKGRHPDVVYMGSYLVNAQGGCNDCHTCPSFRGRDPYQLGGVGTGKVTPVNSLNYLGGGTPFVNGTVTSPNLTPDSSGLPGGMTYAEFVSAMQQGVDSHNSTHVLQVMPWPIFRNLYDNDLRAIYQYLSSIPAASSGAGQCTGPIQTK